MSAAAQSQEGQFRVLIIDDDPYIARLISSNLEKANLQCRQAVDGIDGLSAFKQFNPHLVVTDIMMPGMDGRAVCHTIRETSMVPILIMTAADTSEAELEAFKAGADDYIPKPFDPKLLVARVVANLRRVYRYDAEAYSAGQAAPPTATPGATGDGSAAKPMAGWVTCQTCGYLGPRDKFRKENARGQRFMQCPHCQEAANFTFS